jgi:hypothetical protein
MSKKNEVSAVPVISKIPMPISDTPVVIDLPDGQKLVIGRMNDGSVIEVATWRGTGRPDSRTNRLMLGMSSGQPAQVAPAAAGDSVPTAPVANSVKVNANGLQKIIQVVLAQFSKVNLKGFAKIDLGVVKKFIAQISSKTKSIKSNVPTSAPTVKTEDIDVEEWLRKITEKSAAKKERSIKNSGSAKPKSIQSKPTKKTSSAPSRKK